jgi:hypothetical protein
VLEVQDLLGAPVDGDALADRQRLLAQRKCDYRQLSRAPALGYPARRELVVPIRFGNVRRSKCTPAWVAMDSRLRRLRS